MLQDGRKLGNTEKKLRVDFPPIFKTPVNPFGMKVATIFVKHITNKPVLMRLNGFKEVYYERKMLGIGKM